MENLTTQELEDKLKELQAKDAYVSFFELQAHNMMKLQIKLELDKRSE